MKTANTLNIIFDYPDDSSIIEEIQEKGWRSDVRLKLDKSVFKFHFYHPIRIKQEIDNWMEKGNFDFIIDGILVIQNQLDNNSVRDKIEKMYKSGYFD